MEEKFGGAPVMIIHFDKNGNTTSEERYNLENIRLEKWQVEALARTLLPAIQEFYSHEENVQKFEEWKKKRDAEALASGKGKKGKAKKKT